MKEEEERRRNKEWREMVVFTIATCGGIFPRQMMLTNVAKKIKTELEHLNLGDSNSMESNPDLRGGG